jgi:hypothetical protein
MRRSDLVPLKVVLGELGVSRNTLWRASRSGIVGFPPPVVVRRLVYGRGRDIEKLEEALMSYKGRVVFERERSAKRRVEVLKRAKTFTR